MKGKLVAWSLFRLRKLSPQRTLNNFFTGFFYGDIESAEAHHGEFIARGSIYA